MTDTTLPAAFTALGLHDSLLRALTELGYETPSPIQAQAIPPLLEGRDLLGQAQTGTGKTAAFALPLLTRLELSRKQPQLLVLAPTRELAIQVAEAFQSYARHLPGFHVLPIYGGQAYGIQLRQLKRGPQVIVGTPGRVMDHMRRGSLKLDSLQALVLDEADEMLRMGFIDDVEWILGHTPDQRQVALFSATMPPPIRKVTERYLREPVHVAIKDKTATATTIRQRYWLVDRLHKLDALTRVLEAEPFDAVLIFVRTKSATEELAGKLSARGYAAEALNGDIAQQQRERIVDRLRKGQLDILVGTDVVARGLDVERIGLVINYDIPHDPESYVHRIGRTGRAGREGQAILFVSHRERRLLKAIERTTRQRVEPMQMPTVADINSRRVARFKQRIVDTIASDDLTLSRDIVEQLLQEQEIEPEQIAAALAKLLQGDEPLLLTESPRERKRDPREPRPERGPRADREPRAERQPRHAVKPPPTLDALPLKDHPDVPMLRYRLAVGYQNEVKAGHIIGAIANEGEIESEYIGRLEIYDDFSTIDLPDGMPKDIFQRLRKARVAGRKLQICLLSEWRDDAEPAEPAEQAERPYKKPHPKRRFEARDKRPKKTLHKSRN